MSDALQAACLFAFEGVPVDAKPYGCGHINDTYCVCCERQDKPQRRYILQRVNGNVFQDIPALMDNMIQVTAYLRSKVAEQGGNPDRESLTLVPTKDGAPYYVSSEGAYWRAFIFIENAITYQTAQRPEDFYHSGCAFGRFQRLLADYPSETLHETIPHFHDTAARYRDFELAVSENRSGRAANAEAEIDFIRKRAHQTGVLTTMLAEGELPLRVTHNDTKLNNVMLDDVTGKPVCVIDLDTVMPGLSLYDFGDSIRFGANTAAEDERNLSKVSLSLPLFEAYSRGFLTECGEMLTDNERRLLPFAAKMMTLECGMRFLADYIAGDTYFKVHRENHNLDRCRTQLRLVQDMEDNIDEMSAIIKRLRSPVK